MGKRGPKPKEKTRLDFMDSVRKNADNPAWKEHQGRAGRHGADVLSCMRRKGYTEEQIAAIRAKGLAAAHAKNREYKMQRDLLLRFLKTDVQDVELIAELESYGFEPTFGGGMAYKALCRAMTGDIDAIKYVRDTIGEKPSSDTNINLNTPVKALDMSQLSDAQLMALADRVDSDDEEGLVVRNDEDGADTED